MQEKSIHKERGGQFTVKVSVLFVIYNPNQKEILHIKEVAANTQAVIVDNSSSRSTELKSEGNLHYLYLGGNKGIAEAQNVGINFITSHINAKYIVFFDQDSIVDNNYTNAICSEFERVSKNRSNLAILGPTVIRKDDGTVYAPFIRKETKDSYGFTVRREIISSGSCIPTSIIHAVGCNNPKLFIDYVDFDWCWRANSQGYICGITSKVKIYHKVGKHELHIGRYRVIISSPKRYFYSYRNYLWLCRKKYVPRDWKIKTGIKALARLFYFPLLVRNGIEIWKYMIKGVWEGLTKSF